VVGEALGLALPHSALSPSGSALWLDIARRSAAALLQLVKGKTTTKSIITAESLDNAMAVFCAFGGSTNLLLHIPAIAHAAGLERPTIKSWRRINRQVPRLVDALPNGPIGHPTVRVYLAGAVPEVMLHLRNLDLLDLGVRTVSGKSLGENLAWWESSERRQRLRELLSEREGIDPDDVIYPPERARERGLHGTMTFPTGNLAPEGAVIKSTAIDPSALDPDGVYRFRGPARVFIGERRAIRAIKKGEIRAGDVLVIAGIGPMGSGMEEIFQITAALKNLSWGMNVAVLTDGRFSGVSTGACIGHIGPEALAGGPIGRVLEGDIIEIVIDPGRLEGRVDLIAAAGEAPESGSRRHGEELLRSRSARDDLEPYPDLPEDTRLWAALQALGGGTWGGCVYDSAAIVNALSGAQHGDPRR
jgi:putative YjhG/YagF family dehydratase